VTIIDVEDEVWENEELFKEFEDVLVNKAMAILLTAQELERKNDINDEASLEGLSKIIRNSKKILSTMKKIQKRMK